MFILQIEAGLQLALVSPAFMLCMVPLGQIAPVNRLAS